MSEKLNLHVALDLEDHTTIGEVRAFMELIKDCDDDRPVFANGGLNEDSPALIAYIDLDKNSTE